MLRRWITGSFLCSLGLAMALAAAPFSASAASNWAGPSGAGPNVPQQTGHQPRDPKRIQERLEKQVRHELNMLPFYSIFDSLEYRVDGDRVTVSGQVVHATLQSDAEHVVEKIEGVSSVVNHIEVLPASSFDDRTRFAVYRAVYGDPVLQHYAVGSQDPIHIIVKNGHVTLMGEVRTEMEKNIANIRANSVPFTFSVTNNLRVKSA
jgi:hyperosmotically inducible periplasmic protein